MTSHEQAPVGVTLARRSRQGEAEPWVWHSWGRHAATGARASTLRDESAALAGAPTVGARDWCLSWDRASATSASSCSRGMSQTTRCSRGPRTSATVSERSAAVAASIQ